MAGPLGYINAATKALNYLGDQRDPEDKPESVGPEWVEKYGIGPMNVKLGMSLANLFGKRTEPSAQRTFSTSIGTFLNEHGLGTYKTLGKGASLSGTPAAKRRNKLSTFVRMAQDKYPGLSKAAYAKMFGRSNLDRFFPMISIGDARESRKQEILNPKQNPAWIRITEGLKSGKIKGKGINNALAALRGIENKAASLRENPNYVPKALKAGKGSNLGFKFKGRQTDMTMEGFFKNLQRAFDNDTFLSAAGATQEQPPAQEQPTQERSLAENAFNAFKNIGIGSAISRNVFNPKRLSRPDLGFGQKLFSRQY